MIMHDTATGWKLKYNVHRIEIVCVSIVDGELNNDRAGMTIDPATLFQVLQIGFIVPFRE